MTDAATMAMGDSGLENSSDALGLEIDDRVFFEGALSRSNAAHLHHRFSAARPFPHVVIENLFRPEFLTRISEDFGSIALGDRVHYNTANEIKRGTRPNASLGRASQRYFDAIHRGPFLQFLAAVSGINGLLPDPSLFGGGLHEIPKGGRFSVHTDFNRHPVTDLDNRLVFITYLNKDWQPAFGGALELWDAASQQRAADVMPLFGRSILFAHSAKSLHGHPQPVDTPDGRPRRSVAAYFYTNGRPDEAREERHTTRFVQTGQQGSAQFGRWGRLIVTANYISPMFMDGVRLALRAGSRMRRR